MENRVLRDGDLVTVKLFGKVRSYQITRTDDEYAYHDFPMYGKEPLKFKKEYGYDRDTNTFDISRESGSGKKYKKIWFCFLWKENIDRCKKAE